MTMKKQSKLPSLILKIHYFQKIFLLKKQIFKNKIEQNTFVIFNPPYGIRINKNIDDFYIKIGDTLKNKYKNCTVWIISSDIEKMKYVGLKPSKK